MIGKNNHFIKVAEQLTPVLYLKRVDPLHAIEMIPDANAFQGWKTNLVENMDSLYAKTWGKSESFILDFGDHQVGYLSLNIQSMGSPQDAPLKLKFIFGEMPCEIAESFADYDGWLSSSWLQEETILIDALPVQLQLPRRYSFRYLKILVLDSSPKYKAAFSDIYCTTVTSGDSSCIEPLSENVPNDLKVMDKIGIKTLQDCMQTVFEDGPKRDRRLWIGDLRLQAQANYLTFKNYDLVKRCLYLFGGMTLGGGQVGACVFEKPQPLADDTLLYDYSLFFVATLYDYYMETKDIHVLNELWPVALKQIELGLERLDDRGVVKDDSTWWCFVDWHEELNKQASAQAILLYCLRRALALAEELGLEVLQAYIANQIKRVASAALTYLWNEEKKFFISGADKQVSWASQIWMVLAEAMSQQENTELMKRLLNEAPSIRMSTPYLYHHLIEALVLCGMKEPALEQMRAYWGEMVNDGADCFWELYNPDDKFFSPYGSNPINSYCHAWSCTPAYFIRAYYND